MVDEKGIRERVYDLTRPLPAISTSRYRAIIREFTNILRKKTSIFDQQICLVSTTVEGREPGPYRSSTPQLNLFFILVSSALRRMETYRRDTKLGIQIASSATLPGSIGMENNMFGSIASTILISSGNPEQRERVYCITNIKHIDCNMYQAILRSGIYPSHVLSSVLGPYNHSAL